MSPAANDEPHGHEKRGANHADSAGQPWAGRHFEPNPAAGDDGSADPALLAALTAFAAGEGDPSAVVEAMRSARLLVPLVAQLGEAGENEHGVVVDKTQELAIVTVAGPDGRTVLPAFTSVDSMRAWNPLARPIPVEGVRVAAAALSEPAAPGVGAVLVVIDPVSPTEFALRRPALTALASGESWVPAWVDDAVVAAIADPLNDERAVTEVALLPGDPRARLAGPELEVRVSVIPGLDEVALTELIARIQQAWAASSVIATRVDSLSLRIVAAA
jgi:hypothetical protein